MTDIRTGACLCGAVQIEAELSSGVSCCHCEQCRRWTGGAPHYAVDVADVVVTGGENISHYRASKWGERGNCRICGTPIYWKMQDRGITSVAVGLLNDQTGLEVEQEIFTDCRAPWSVPFKGASQSTEAEEQVKLDAYLAKQK